jgi:hypothetical protein
MSIETKDFVAIWDDYRSMLPDDSHIYEGIIIKLKNNDTNFNIEEKSHFHELVELIADAIYTVKISTNIHCTVGTHYRQTQIYDEPQLDYCSNLLDYLDNEIIRHMDDSYDKAFTQQFK